MTIALLYGGRSTEHEVSLSSAAGVLKALVALPDTEVELIGLDRDGVWYHQTFDRQLDRADARDDRRHVLSHLRRQ